MHWATNKNCQKYDLRYMGLEKSAQKNMKDKCRRANDHYQQL